MKCALIQEILPSVNDHPKLSPPVADMIVADQFVPKKRCDPRQRVAQHGATDVTDMHRFGHVGGSEINHDAPRRFCLHNAESFIAQNAGGFFGDGARPQHKINKTRACNQWRFVKIANVEMTDDFLRELPRIFAALLSEYQSSICLIIAEAWVCCWR